MSIQLSDLTVTDPLADQEVIAVVRILPDNVQRPARTALVSVGVSGQPPVFVSGVLNDVAGLIRQAWLAYGLRADVRQRNAEESAVAVAVAETVAEAVVDNGGGEEEASPAAPAQPQAPPARPQPQNLSLF